MVFTAPTGETATVYGVHTKHNTSIDQDGMRVNSPNVHVSVSERLLIEQYYPVRNDKNEVVMATDRHKVTVADSNGLEITYKVLECWPDQTLGVLVMLLGAYKSQGGS